jgi:hypothetical protein
LDFLAGVEAVVVPVVVVVVVVVSFPRENDFFDLATQRQAKPSKWQQVLIGQASK